MRLFFAVTLAVLAGGCSFPCADCGPCGLMGGPNGANVLNFIPGIGPKDDLEVELRAGGPSDCGTTTASWMDASGLLTPHLQGDVLDRSVKESSGTWTHAGTTVTIQRLTGTQVKLDFQTKTSAPVSRTCTTADGKTITCS